MAKVLYQKLRLKSTTCIYVGVPKTSAKVYDMYVGVPKTSAKVYDMYVGVPKTSAKVYDMYIRRCTKNLS